MEKKKSNAGRKSKYGEEVVASNYRCPKSKAVEFRAKVNAILKTYELPK